MNNTFVPSDPRNISPPMIRASANLTALKIIGFLLFLMVAAIPGLIAIGLIGLETGPAELMIGMICACLPVPFYVALLLWIDRYEAEPLWLLGGTFVWGAFVAVFIALLLNTVNGAIVTAATNNARVGENFGAVISAPIVEESAKGFVLLLVFLFKSEFDGIVDGVIYAGMVGLGFAMTENILYYGRAIQAGAGALTFTFILRGMAAPFSHPLFTSMTGIGLGWSRQSNNGFVKVVMPFLGFMLAVLLHATWNGAATYGGAAGFFAGYFLIMGPAFIITLMVVFFSLRREGRIVRQFLYPDYQRGFFDAIEYEKLCSIRGRMGLSWNAMMTGGFSGWRKRMRCNQIASELAFHRSRVARGVARNPQANQERENAYLWSLYELRQKLNPGMPAPR